MTSYVITNLGNASEWVISEAGDFVVQETSLSAALTYLATVLQYGDTITYADEPLAP